MKFKVHQLHIGTLLELDSLSSRIHECQFGTCAYTRLCLLYTRARLICQLSVQDYNKETISKYYVLEKRDLFN